MKVSTALFYSLCSVLTLFSVSDNTKHRNPPLAGIFPRIRFRYATWKLPPHTHSRHWTSSLGMQRFFEANDPKQHSNRYEPPRSSGGRNASEMPRYAGRGQYASPTPAFPSPAHSPTLTYKKLEDRRLTQDEYENEACRGLVFHDVSVSQFFFLLHTLNFFFLNKIWAASVFWYA